MVEIITKEFILMGRTVDLVRPGASLAPDLASPTAEGAAGQASLVLPKGQCPSLSCPYRMALS